MDGAPCLFSYPYQPAEVVFESMVKTTRSVWLSLLSRHLQDAFAGLQRLATELNGMQLAAGAGGAPAPTPDRLLLTAKAHLKLGLWRRSLTEVCPLAGSSGGW